MLQQSSEPAVTEDDPIAGIRPCPHRWQIISTEVRPGGLFSGHLGAQYGEIRRLRAQKGFV